MKLEKIVFLIFVVILMGCKKTNLANPDTKAIIGKWQYLWGGEGQYNSKNYFEFKKHGQFKVYEGILLKHIDEFELKLKHTLINSGKEEYVIDYKFNPIDHCFKVSHDTLYLNEDANDGSDFTFLRIH